jgi:AcrR family transcriptional regulator
MKESTHLPTDSRYLYKPTVGLSNGAHALKKPTEESPADKRLERGLETRRTIIETATRLFAEHGYAAVSIDAVLAACQISRGALYHHFLSKEALLEAVFEAVEIDVTNKVVARAASASGAGTAAINLTRIGAVNPTASAVGEIGGTRAGVGDSVIGTTGRIATATAAGATSGGNPVSVLATDFGGEGGSGSAVEALQAGCEAFLDLTQDPVVRQIMLTDAPSVLGWGKWREIDERHAFGLMKAALEPAAREAGIRAALIDTFAHMLLASLSEIALVIAEADDASLAVENGKEAVRELLARILARPANDPPSPKGAGGGR